MSVKIEVSDEVINADVITLCNPLAVKRAVVLPENPTNGDVIKALFPMIKTKEYRTFIRVIDGEEYCSIDYRWWNSPYKADKESEDKNV